jgi:hypothetical protein
MLTVQTKRNLLRSVANLAKFRVPMGFGVVNEMRRNKQLPKKGKEIYYENK